MNMKMTNIYQLAKAVHRVLVLVVTVLLIVMAGTGLLMKYPAFASRYVGVLDVGLVRFIHNQLSVAFTAVLVLMALSGLVMYVYPLYARRRNRAAAPSSPGQSSTNK